MADLDLKKISVLVVDDEVFMRKLIGRMLSELGFGAIVEAHDGIDGLAKLKLDTPHIDIVLLDLEMPTFNGFQFIEHVRSAADVPDPKVPIVVLTGHSERENVIEAAKLGIHGYMVKPVSKAIMLARLEKALTSAPVDPRKIKG
jgi:two-component system, chemotaxis family, chemotaxis protein CheY